MCYFLIIYEIVQARMFKFVETFILMIIEGDRLFGYFALCEWYIKFMLHHELNTWMVVLNNLIWTSYLRFWGKLCKENVVSCLFWEKTRVEFFLLRLFLKIEKIAWKNYIHIIHVRFIYYDIDHYNLKVPIVWFKSNVLIYLAMW